MPNDTLAPLSNLLSIDQLPEELHLSDLTPGFLDDIQFKNHVKTGESESGHEATHNLTLEFPSPIGFAFPGSDIKLLLNPSQNGSPQTSQIDIEVYYKWNIIKFIDDFSIDNVPTDFNSLIAIVTNIYDINIQNVLEKLISLWDDVAEAINIPVDAILEEINKFYDLTGTVDEITFDGEIPSLEGLETKLNELGISLSQVVSDFNLAGVISDPTSAIDVFGAVINKHIYNLVETLNTKFNLTSVDKIDYDLDLDFSAVATKLFNLGKDAIGIITELVVDLAETWENIKSTLFSFLSLRVTGLPTSFEALFIPEIDAAVYDVNLALEFPQPMLIPMDDQDNLLDPPATAKLTFQVGDFTFSTQNGFDFSEVSSCELRQSSIMETGITIEFTDCFIDFHDDSNIPQADADGRPLAFKGAFIDEAIINLPKIWQTDESQPTTAVIRGDDLLIGDPGGFTGHLLMAADNQGDLLHFELPGFFKVSLNDFDLLFNQNSLDQTNINGTLIIQGLKQQNGNDAEVDINVNIVNDIYTVQATDFDPFVLAEIEIEITQLILTIQQGQFIPPTAINGTLTFPVINDGSDTPSPVPMNFSGEIFETHKLLTINNVPPLHLFGLGISLQAFSIQFDNTQIQEATILGTLTIPFLDDAEIDLTFLIKDDGYELGAESDTRFDLLGLGIILGDIDASWGSSGLSEFTVNECELFIPGLEDEQNQEFPIVFDFTFSESLYHLSTSGPIDDLQLYGLAIKLEEVGIDAIGRNLSQLDINGSLAFPVVDDNHGQRQWVEFGLSADSNSIVISASNIPTLYLGGIEISLLTLSIGFDGTGIIESETEISGTVNIPAFNLALTVSINFTESGFGIKAEVPASAGYVDVLNIEDMINVQLSSLEIGKSGSNWTFAFGGKINNYIVIPGIEKFIPKVINVEKFELTAPDAVEVDIEMEWPNGFKVENIGQGGSTSSTKAVNQSFGDLMSLRAIQIDTTVGSRTEITARLLGTKFTLGPVNCTIEGIGFEASVEAKTNGNLGPIDVGLGLLYPTGIAIGLDTDIFKGGGYLFFDRDNNRYAGAIELSFQDKFSLSAIGLLTTQLPDGSKGTSLLIIITTQFPAPIPLGYNFFLAGVGGLIGLHRTTNTDKLRSSVVSGTIDNILFPTNVMANVSQIVSDLREIFPPKRDQFLIGPIAMITWSSPPLLSVELGLIIEFDDPVVIVILGVIKANIPNPDNALIKLQVNFVGIIDFDTGMLSFDAALFDSRIVSFSLDGSMALRLSWGQQPDFALSVGGFHPAYTAPSHLKFLDMTRLTISLMGGNPRLTLTSYFAVTTNTVQFGAAIDFYFKVSKFKVVGGFGFDVLFMFDPFRFIAEIRAGLAVKCGSSTLFSISLKFTLQGPSPWIASGTASFKIWFVKIKVRFNKTFGEEKRISLPDINVLPLILEALENSRNWTSELPANRYDLVVLRKDDDLEEDDIILQTFGTLTVSQKVVPLGMEIERFGNNNPVGDKRFEISDVSLINATGESPMTTNLVREDFVPSNYKEMEDSDKLSAPSFEKMRSGFRAQGLDEMKTEFGYNRDVEYEVIVSDFNRNAGNAAAEGLTANGIQQPDLYTPSGTFFTHFAKGGAVRNAALSRKNKAKAFKNERNVSLKPEEFSLVFNDNLFVFEPTFRKGTKAEVNERYMQIITADPILKGILMIVPFYKAKYYSWEMPTEV